MKVFVKGKGRVNLTQQNFVGTGGQASVYVKDALAYKIYTDPAHTIPDAKFYELSVIDNPRVLKPMDLLLDDKGQESIGYTMQGVLDTCGFNQLFTKAFRERNNIKPDQIVNLAAKLRDYVDGIHKKGILIVDLNEFNILVPKTYDDLYLIDVDSYQTKSYPATVILPSVRDFSVPASQFSPLSDWFSYGVLTFQLFVGIHPYRGVHKPTEHIDKDSRMEHRMRNHISAFRPEVGLPKCCYSFDQIPQTFRDWLKAVLDDGMRVPPPDPRGGVAVIRGPVAVTQTQFTVTSGKLVIEEIQDLEKWTLVQYVESGGRSLALVTNGSDMRVLLDGRPIHAGPALTGETILGFTPKMNEPIALNLSRGQLTFFDFNRKRQETLDIYAVEIAKSGGRMYLRNGTRVLEVEFSEQPSKIVVTASHMVADVLELASHLYEGAAIQNMLGTIYVSLFPQSKTGYQVKVPELNKYKIVDAKFDGGVLMVVGAKDGQYDRLIFRFDENYTTYDLRVVSDITPSGLNFITLDSGICVSLTEDEKIEAFSARKGSQGIKVVEDPALGNDMRLIKVRGKVGFERQGKVYQLSMK